METLIYILLALELFVFVTYTCVLLWAVGTAVYEKAINKSTELKKQVKIKKDGNKSAAMFFIEYFSTIIIIPILYYSLHSAAPCIGVIVALFIYNIVLSVKYILAIKPLKNAEPPTDVPS